MSKLIFTNYINESISGNVIDTIADPKSKESIICLKKFIKNPDTKNCKCVKETVLPISRKNEICASSSFETRLIDLQHSFYEADYITLNALRYLGADLSSSNDIEDYIRSNLSGVLYFD